MMHSNTTNQGTDKKQDVNYYDMENSASLYDGGNITKRRAKNGGDINRRERRSLEQISIWTILTKLMVIAIKEKTSEKLQGTGVTIDDLLKTPYTQVEDLNRRLNNANVEDLKLTKLLKLSYTEIRDKMKALVDPLSQSGSIPKKYATQFSDESINQYIEFVKDHYAEMVMLFTLPINNHGVILPLYNNEEFLLPFLPLLQELSFNDHDLIAKWQNYNLILNQNSHKAEYDLFNIFGLYYNNNEKTQESLIKKFRFRAACLVNDWKEASIWLKHSGDGVAMWALEEREIKLAMRYALVFDVDISKNLNFLNSLWSKAVVLQDQMKITNDRLLKEMLTYNNYQSLARSIISDKLLLIHWMLGKANTLGIADKMLISGVAQADGLNNIQMINRLLDITQELSIRNAILPGCIATVAINDHNEVIGILLNRVQEIDVRNEILRVSIALVAAFDGNRAGAIGLLLNRPEAFAIRNQMLQAGIVAAAKNGHNEVVELLLNRPGAFAIQNQMLLDGIVAAAENGHDGTIELLLNRPEALDIRNQMLLDGIVVAAENNHDGTVELLLNRPEALAIRNQMLQTSTVAAAANGCFATVNLLLEKAEELGVTRAMLQAGDYKAFRSAVTNGHFTTVNLLLGKAEGLDIKSEMLQADNRSAFVSAVRNRDENMLESLWNDANGSLESDMLYEMLKANNYEVFKLAVQKDSYGLINSLCNIAENLRDDVGKEVLLDMFAVDDYEVFRTAAQIDSYQTMSMLLGLVINDDEDEKFLSFLLNSTDYEVLFHIISRFSDKREFVDKIMSTVMYADDFDVEKVAKSARMRSIDRVKWQGYLDSTSNSEVQNWVQKFISLTDRDSKQLEQSEHEQSVKRPSEDAEAGPSGYKPPAKKLCKGERKKRKAGLACVDGLNKEEEIGGEEKKKFIKEIFNSDKMKELIKSAEFYNQLSSVSQKISKGEEVADKDIEDLIVKAEDLDSIDPEMKNIIKELKGNKEKIGEIINRPTVLEKVEKTTSWAMRAMMFGNIIGAISDGNYEDAVTNSLVIVGDAAIGRAIGATPITWYLMVRSLADDIERLSAGEKGNIIIKTGFDSVTLSVMMLSTIIPELGPVADALMLGEQAWLAVERVATEDKIVHLTEIEKFVEGVRAFFSVKPEEYITDLMSKKKANNKLVENAIEFLKQHINIQRYVFPTGEYVIDKDNCRTTCESGSNPGFLAVGGFKEKCKEDCDQKIQVDEDSDVLLNDKRPDINWSRARPDSYSGMELFCQPGRISDKLDSPNIMSNPDWIGYMPGKKEEKEEDHEYERIFDQAYYCRNAIGLSDSNNRTGNYTLVALGEGQDAAHGFIDNPNIFLVHSGNKRFFGGNEDDVFILEGDGITGILDGSAKPDEERGNNKLSLASFAPGADYIQVQLKEDEGSVFSSFSKTNVTVRSMHIIEGRKGKQDIIEHDCNVKIIDGQGGESDNKLDKITISNCNRDSKTPQQVIVRPNTHVINLDKSNDFNYIIPLSTGEALINIQSDRKNNVTSEGMHSFVFGCTLANLTSINVTDIPFLNNTTVRTVKFSLLVNNSADERFNITISDVPNNATFALSDNAEIKIGNHGNLYIFQNTNDSVDKVIKDYPKIANRLNATITVQSCGEPIMIGCGKHEIFKVNPTKSKSHLVGNGGENVYIINPPTTKLKSSKDQQEFEVNIYDIDKENTIDSLDLHNVIKGLSNKQIIQVLQSGDDLLIKLPIERDTLNGTITVKIKKGVHWRQKLHVYLDNKAPMQFELSNDRWKLKSILALKDVKVIPTSLFRYYKPNNEQGLQIYHNQPDNKHQIGLVDLKDKSILDCNMQVIDSSLVLSFKGNTIVKVENWLGSQEAREMIFDFSDALISNAKCVISTCDPKDIVEEFQQEKNRINAKMHIEDKEVHPIRHRRHHVGRYRHSHHSVEEAKISAAKSSSTKPKSWINEGIMWMKELVISVKDMISEPSIKNLLPFMFKKTLCHTINLQGNLEFNIGQQYKSHKARIQSDGKSEFSKNQAFGFSNFLSNKNTALAHCIAEALDNNSAKRYQDLKNKGVEVAPNSNTAVNWALERFDEFVESKINGLSVKEKQVIRTELKNVYPEIIASLDRGFEYIGNVGLDDVLEKCKECFCKNLSTYLSDIKVTTTLGNNLGR